MTSLEGGSRAYSSASDLASHQSGACSHFVRMPLSLRDGYRQGLAGAAEIVAVARARRLWSPVELFMAMWSLEAGIGVRPGGPNLPPGRTTSTFHRGTRLARRLGAAATVPGVPATGVPAPIFVVPTRPAGATPSGGAAESGGQKASSHAAAAQGRAPERAPPATPVEGQAWRGTKRRGREAARGGPRATLGARGGCATKRTPAAPEVSRERRPGATGSGGPSRRAAGRPGRERPASQAAKPPGWRGRSPARAEGPPKA